MPQPLECPLPPENPLLREEILDVGMDSPPFLKFLEVWRFRGHWLS